jgi:hypothetical protein
MPRPPAAATAAASSVVPTPPIAANWSGKEQPTRSVKRLLGWFKFSPSLPARDAP